MPMTCDVAERGFIDTLTLGHNPLKEIVIDCFRERVSA